MWLKYIMIVSKILIPHSSGVQYQGGSLHEVRANTNLMFLLRERLETPKYYILK